MTTADETGRSNLLARQFNRRRFLKRAGAALALGLAVGYPLVGERYLVRTNAYRIAVPNLPRVFRGFRIAHLTDIHYGLLMPLGQVRSVVERTNALNADAIVFTGDAVHGKRSTQEIDAVWPLLARLRAPSGVYSVLGNHDHWADTGRSLYWLDRAGQNLHHRATAIQRDGQRLWLAGAGDLWEDHRGLDGVLADIPENECRIVLAHNPDTADTAFASRADLIVSGHTHGGQVYIPFIGPPVLPVANKTYASGFTQSARGTGVFISKGIGCSIIPVRFNCAPEIAVLELVDAGKEGGG